MMLSKPAMSVLHQSVQPFARRGEILHEFEYHAAHRHRRIHEAHALADPIRRERTRTRITGLRELVDLRERWFADETLKGHRQRFRRTGRLPRVGPRRAQ